MVASRDQTLDGLRSTLTDAKRNYESRLAAAESTLSARESEVSGRHMRQAPPSTPAHRPATIFWLAGHASVLSLHRQAWAGGWLRGAGGSAYQSLVQQVLTARLGTFAAAQIAGMQAELLALRTEREELEGRLHKGLTSLSRTEHELQVGWQPGASCAQAGGPGSC